MRKNDERVSLSACWHLLQKEEEALAHKRKLLLEKNTRLTPVLSQSHDLKEGVEIGDSQEDLYDDIMLLNDEVDAQDEQLSGVKRHYQRLLGVLQDTKKELYGEKEQHHVGAELTLCLSKQLDRLRAVMGKLVQLVEEINGLQQSKRSSSPPLQHMLQLPAQASPPPSLPLPLWSSLGFAERA